MQSQESYVDLEVRAIGLHTFTPIHENNGPRNGDCGVALVSLHIWVAMEPAPSFSCDKRLWVWLSQVFTIYWTRAQIT